jgi:hypothetical protein
MIGTTGSYRKTLEKRSDKIENNIITDFTFGYVYAKEMILNA